MWLAPGVGNDMEGANMLEKILRAVSAGGVHSVRELARQLDVSEELLETMLDQLVRMGYLKPLAAACSGHCHNCPETGSCCVGNSSGRAWVVTASGQKLV